MAAAPRFRDELKTVSGRRFTRRCYRLVELEAYSDSPTPTLLFDLGPKSASGAGQRYSPPGDHRGLYIALEPDTAGAEFSGGALEWRRKECPEFAFLKISVKLRAVLNLEDAKVRRKLGVTKQAIQAPWRGYARFNNGTWPATWRLGHEAFACGRLDGIRFPSVPAKGGSCLLVFTERLEAGKTSVTVHRKDGSIW